MDIFESVKTLLGIKSVPVSEVNRRATLQPRSSTDIKKDLLKEIHISDEYKVVKKLLEEGCPIIFVTGNAGTGKSTLIKYLRAVLEKKHVVVAPTGVAALNVQGVTIHSFFRFPPRILNKGDIKLVSDRMLYKELELLIIDEVSMARCDLIDSIDKFLRKNRSSNEPFGGVQLLLVGDLFQLPPVVPQQEMSVLREKGYASKFFFSSFSLQQCSLTPYVLTTSYRQEDQSFIHLLNKMRIAENLDSVVTEVNRKCYCQDRIKADIALTCTNSQADQINRVELSRLSSEEHCFIGKIEGQFRIGEDKLPSPINLTLKAGTHVMFTKNDTQRRWVNGTLGIVQDITSTGIRVKLIDESSDVIHDVHRVSWETYKYIYDSNQDKILAKKIGEYTQYPLMLAWAVTIHKSQGKTLDNVLLDFGDGTFESGQAYVGFSRCRSIKGIRLKHQIRNTDIKCDPIIKRFYNALETI